MAPIGTRNSGLELAARTEWQSDGLKCERVDLLYPDKVLEGRIFVPVIGRRHPLVSQYNRTSQLSTGRIRLNRREGVAVDQGLSLRTTSADILPISDDAVTINATVSIV
jgi:hypothetical protein